MDPVLPNPALCLVTDRRVCPPDELPGRVSAAIAGGVDIVQLRDKDEPGSNLLELALALREVARPPAIFLVNERADVAIAAGANGVQLGEAAMPTSAVRPILPDGAIIGRSIHSVEGAMQAEQSGADFLLVGTMFATPVSSRRGAVRARPVGAHQVGEREYAAPGHRWHHRRQRRPSHPGRRQRCGGYHCHPRQRGPATGGLAHKIGHAGRGSRRGREPESRQPLYYEPEVSVGMITLQVNGKPRDIDEGLNLQSYLATIDVNMRFIAVGYNGQVIRKEDFEKVKLHPGDALEIVRPVGGG